MIQSPSAAPAAVPDIVVTNKDRRHLEHIIADHAPIRAWRAVEFLIGELRRARSVDDVDTPANVVTMHSQVEFRDDSLGVTQVASLVYPGERQLYEDGLSVITPMGAALIGLTEGQTLSFPDAGGGTRSITVTRVLYQPEAARRADRAKRAGSARQGRRRAVDAAAPEVFDEDGHLAPHCHRQICAWLNETGQWGPVRQSRLLSEELGYPHDAEIWAVLMWNARPSPCLAEKLERWLRRGMPVSSADRAMAAPAAAGASAAG
jgi:regulator of nucleoside diphosphate kinase